MPQVKPIELELQTDPVKTETYNPSYGTSTSAVFTSLGARFSENLSLKATIRPAAAGNTGHRADWLGVRPIPADTSQAGCCVDKDNIPANTFTIGTLLRKEASNAQAIELVEMIRAFVNSQEFEDTVIGQAFYP